MGMCKWFFRDATKIQNGCQRSTLKNCVGAKILKLKVRNYLNFTITFPMIWRCAGYFFKVLLKFKMAATDQLFLEGRRNSKNLFGQFFWNFNITFLATWGCASDFSKMLQNFKIAARGQLQIFLWAQKLQNSKSEISQISLSHSLRYGDVQVFF